MEKSSTRTSSIPGIDRTSYEELNLFSLWRLDGGLYHLKRNPYPIMSEAEKPGTEDAVGNEVETDLGDRDILWIN